MRNLVCFVLFITLFTIFSCKKRERSVEPVYILKKWADSIRDLNYGDFCKYEAYPKSEAVFREMYKDYYIVDLMVTDMKDVDEGDIRKDHDGKRYLHMSVSFEGAIVKRRRKEPCQILRGDAVFIKFIDGKRAKDNWLISNRTFIRIDR